MLEVMSAGSTVLSPTKREHGILLNCWDKSSPLIEELERTVNFAERKCGDLMQQLHFYKEYYEKWAQVERVNHLCHKKKKKCLKEALEVESSSENEFEKVNQYFYKKIKNKINEMSNEISEASRKMNSKSKFPTLPHPAADDTNETNETTLEEKTATPTEPLPLALENKICRSEPIVATSDDCNPVMDSEPEGLKVVERQSSKSVPARGRTFKSLKRETGSGTKRRFSNLQRYKLRSKSLPQGVRRKFGFGGFFEVIEHKTAFGETVDSRSKSRTPSRADSSKSLKSRKSLPMSKSKNSESKKITPKNSRQRIQKFTSDVRHSFRNSKSESDTKKSANIQVSCPVLDNEATKDSNVCKAIVPSSNVPDVSNADFNLTGNLKNLIAKPNVLLPFLRHPIPFIPCSSTSKSFNLGLNVQEVLSLIKRKRHSVTLQAVVKNSMQAARSITEPTVNTLFISQMTTSHSHVTSAICPAREGSEDSFSVVTHNRSKCSLLKQVQTIRSQGTEEKSKAADSVLQITANKLDRPEDVWVVDQPDPVAGELGNVRSRCTCFPSKHCVDYHKVLRQYTGWQLAGDTHPDSHSSYLCTKSKLYTIPSQDNMHYAGKDSNAGKTVLFKVHKDLLSLTRRYSSLQEQISQNCLDEYEANAELDAMESELALREIELKDILNFYNQLMALKEKLKSLRLRTDQSQPSTAHVEGHRPKRDPLRPTPSMALAKVLKKIQGLQDKIKLIGAP